MTTPIKPLLRNKRGMDYYVFIVSIVGVLMLSFITFSLFTKQYELSSGLSTGTEQFRVLKTYAVAERALLFVDDAARLSLEQAAYATGKGGFYKSAPVCGSKDSFNYWAKDSISGANGCIPETTTCYPDEAAVKSTFLTSFESSFGGFVKSFNSKSEVKIPFNYEPFTVAPVVGRTEVVGKSKDAITINIPNVKYEVKPSFRESIPVDVVANGKEVVTSSQLLVKLDKGDTEKKIDKFNKAKKFEWKLVDYSKSSSSCTYDTGNSCSYDCGDDCTTSCVEVCPDSDPATGEDVCCKEETSCVDVFCDGTIKTTVPYDKISSLTSATENQKLLVIDEATKKPAFKNLKYDFGLSWIETGSSSDTCS